MKLRTLAKSVVLSERSEAKDLNAPETQWTECVKQAP